MEVQAFTYTGNADSEQTITVGFAPKIVLVWSLGVSGMRCRTDNFNADESVNWNGNTPNPWPTDGIRDFSSTGFEAGSAINSDGVTYHVFAMGSDANVIATGGYTGDAGGARRIRCGFEPEFIYTVHDGASGTSQNKIWMRARALTPDARDAQSPPEDNYVAMPAGRWANAGVIEGTYDGGFIVDGADNSIGNTFQWFALARGPQIITGHHRGNGATDRRIVSGTFSAQGEENIEILGIYPAFAMVKMHNVFGGMACKSYNMAEAETHGFTGSTLATIEEFGILSDLTWDPIYRLGFEVSDPNPPITPMTTNGNRTVNAPFDYYHLVIGFGFPGGTPPGGGGGEFDFADPSPYQIFKNNRKMSETIRRLRIA